MPNHKTGSHLIRSALAAGLLLSGLTVLLGKASILSSND